MADLMNLDASEAERIDRTLLRVIADTADRIRWAEQHTDMAETIRRAESAQRAALKIAWARGVSPRLMASALGVSQTERRDN